ncbi:MAG TPA: helix-hairpin-helix domain-containing protein [Cyclobacteriaceae bacterium]|nr:helix-hairpin-helix domain-containing protein [Cyclobacteriaceae bacterium]HMV08590.1 helix-hairpin-helix domain-containing protein [Cyclobacteriaceae bacterium]HMV91061.1 helix-hairpin-helix domain-containing protein [Cyclobacteriaceae bacterium]HMX00201.1 helix-hairpin-helix domain-containing protein [Cyclobacteriaceae bacterium]HMX49800.1 helix-hairpin-helix domain-containing protein [Cyclobacteriaceae bacterium]
MRTWVVFLVLLGNAISTKLFAQDYPQRDVNLEILADEIFGFQDLDLNYQKLYETMAQLLANKINLNTASAEELRFLNLLTEQQVQNLITYREENGKLLSVYELQAVPGFDAATIRKIISFVRVDGSDTGNLLKRVISEPNNYLITRYNRTLEAKRGFKNDESAQTKFKGDEGDLYLRFRTSKPGDFSFGLTLEKDAGEQLQWNKSTQQYGFDFQSFHGQLLNKGRLKNLIVGDYQAQFGQGLLLGGSFGFGKGSEAVTTVRRSNLGFLPYTSANETGYKRGAAATWQVIEYVYLSGFYSNALRDGSVTADSLESSSLSAFQTTGLHRNENELAGRHTAREQNYGVVLNFKKGPVDAGVIFNRIEYNIPISRNPQPYNQFSFSGTTVMNAGAFLNYTFHNFTFFSEGARTIDEGYGITAGILGSLTPRLDIALHFRNYERNFCSLYSNAFSESTMPQNESGLYWGWKYRWSRKFSASGYTDLFRFPWLKFRSYVPSEGHEWLARFSYQPSKNVLIFIQAREESKVRNASYPHANTYETAIGTKRNYWVNFDYPVSDRIKMKTRAQFSTYSFGNSFTKGMIILQDVRAEFGKLAVTARYAIFDARDYDNRQYVYERDVWLAYSLPAYSGIGLRSYLLAEFDVNKRITFWIRYSHTRYTDRDTIGSGADMISGKEKNDLRIQARIKILN